MLHLLLQIALNVSLGLSIVNRLFVTRDHSAARSLETIYRLPQNFPVNRVNFTGAAINAIYKCDPQVPCLYLIAFDRNGIRFRGCTAFVAGLSRRRARDLEINIGREILMMLRLEARVPRDSIHLGFLLGNEYNFSGRGY